MTDKYTTISPVLEKVWQYMTAEGGMPKWQDVDEARKELAALLAERDAFELDARRYRVLRMFALNSGSWPFRDIPAPSGIIAWSRRHDEAGMTQAELDKLIDDMLGLLPAPDGARQDYQAWRAARTAESIARAALGEKQ